MKTKKQILKMSKEEEISQREAIKTSEQLEEELKKLKEEIEEESKKKQIQKQINQLNFQKKHKGLLKVTRTLESGTKGFFKGMGKLITGSAEALAKSDKFIKEQYKKERINEDNRKKVEHKKDTSIKDALDILD